MKRLQSISDINSEDGTHTCSYCHLQLGEGEDNCMNCALFQHEFEKEMLIKLYEEIKPSMLHMEPDVVAYKSTPSLVPHAERVEKFMTIMRDALKEDDDNHIYLSDKDRKDIMDNVA